MGNTSNGRIWIATLTGAAIGAAVSILYAPRSGRATRTKIRRGAEQASESFGKAAMELQGRVFDGMEEGGDELGYLIGSAISRTASTTKEIIVAMEKELAELKAENKR